MPRVYRYRKSATAPTYVVSLIGFLFLSALLVAVSETIGASSLSWDIWFAAGLAPAGAAGVGVTAFILWRPIIMTPDGISNTLFGRPKTSLRWDDVTKIERLIFYDNFIMKHRFQFRIYGGRFQIRFDDYIEDFGCIVEKLNDAVSSYHIPAFEVEGSQQAQRMPVSKLADIIQKKSLDDSRRATARF